MANISYYKLKIQNNFCNNSHQISKKMVKQHWDHVRFNINHCESVCLPNQEASTEVSESVSLALCSFVLPVKAGMTMLEIKNRFGQ